MAFEVLVHHSDSDISDLFLWMSEELNFRVTTLMTYGFSDWSEEYFNIKEFELKYREHLKKNTPNIVVNFLPSHFNELDKNYLKQAKITAKLCKEYDIPFIQFSSYQALKENKKSKYHSLLNQLENIVHVQSRQIILRMGWLLDAKHDSICALLLPSLIEEYNGFDDQKMFDVSEMIFGAPITVKFVARCLSAIILQVLCGADNWGLYPMSSSDKCSEAEIADSLSRIITNDTEFTSAQINAKTTHPSIMSGSGLFEKRRLMNDFGMQCPSWRRGSKKIIIKWLENYE